MTPDMSRFVTSEGPYTLVELRHADIQTLRDWRNRQIDVLRQKHPLSEEDQERWFEEIVLPTHATEEPRFLLVSILLDEAFVGYGGLTNIDWEHRRAEVSFLVDPERVANPELYRDDFTSFLAFLQKWAFGTLELNRLFTETYAFRDDHIEILESAGFVDEGRLRQHVRVDGEFTDSILHGCVAPNNEQETT